MANNQLTTMPMDDLSKMSTAFAISGMFPDIKSAAQAMVKIQAGLEIGIKPFAAMTGIHIILGKPEIGAGICAGRVKASGKYDYKIKELTDKNCIIDFYEDSQFIGNSTFSIEDAKKAGTKNIDKYARNMLFARAISNGVKWFCPDVFDMPIYTEDEIVTEDIMAVVQPVKVIQEDKSDERMTKLLNACETRKDLKRLFKDISSEEHRSLYDELWKKLEPLPKEEVNDKD